MTRNEFLTRYSDKIRNRWGGRPMTGIWYSQGEDYDAYDMVVINTPDDIEVYEYKFSNKKGLVADYSKEAKNYGEAFLNGAWLTTYFFYNKASKEFDIESLKNSQMVKNWLSFVSKKWDKIVATFNAAEFGSKQNIDFEKAVNVMREIGVNVDNERRLSRKSIASLFPSIKIQQ